MTTPTVSPVQQAGWLLDDMIMRQNGIHHAVIVSADGLTIARSQRLSTEHGDQLGAITAGIISLTLGAARQFGAEPVRQTVVGMDGLNLCLMSVSNGSHLAVLAAEEADLGAVVYAMCELVERVGQMAFTPENRRVM
jgi:predicted regulator of Ras-like GTPase activity (Roadblock/LC7/MglB family)